MKDGKPSVTEIIELLPKCREVYQGVHDEFQKDDDFYELNFKGKLEIPEEFKSKGIVLPTARDMVDTFVDNIDIANARVFVNKKGTSATSFEEAEMMRKFYLGLIHRTNVEADISPWRVAAKHYALYGLGVFKTVYDADRWPDKPERQGNESEDDFAARSDEWRHETHESLPIVVQAINPYCIFPDPSYGGRQFVIEEQKRTVFDISKRWPTWKNPNSKKLNEPVTYLQYWDKEYRCDLIDEEPVLPVKGGVVAHNYGFIPYILMDSGLGNISFEAEPKKRYVGMLRYMYDILVSESRDYSINDIVLARTAWPWFTIEGDNASAVTELKQTFGTATPMPANTKVVPQISQVPPEALNTHLAITADYIASHGGPRSVRGLGETGVRSGADRRLVIDKGTDRYKYSTESFKNGTAKALANCARLMKNVVPGDIRVWAKTPTDEFDVEIKKEKMKEPFTCYVEFAPISEEDEYRRHDDLERLVSSGIVTRRWARSQMSNVDPIAMEEDEEREKFKNDPNLYAIQAQYAAGRLAQAISARSMAEGLSTGLPMQSPAPGQTPEAGRSLVPPIPNVAPLGSAQDMQNKLKQNRSQTSMKPMQGVGGGGNRP